MRNIWRIIKADARSLFTHFFALAVALAIAVLPSLYAWLNIYSNWDPYGNTGNISIAVASLDKGWTEEDGAQVNKGQEVVEDLRSSTSINWVAVDTKEEAEHGVYAGDYYAAVVIDEDFPARCTACSRTGTAGPPSLTTKTPRRTPWPPRSPTRRWRR